MSKFKTDQKCILIATGKEVEILNVKVTFVPPSTKYTLKETGEVVNETELVPLKEKTSTPGNPGDQTIEDLRAKYAELYGKQVAKAYQNKQEWIETKIQEKEAANALVKGNISDDPTLDGNTINNPANEGGDDNDNTDAPDITVDSLQDLDIDELTLLIEEKDLALDPDDYTVEDLRQAIAEELGLV